MAYSQSEPLPGGPHKPNGFYALGNSSPCKVKYDAFCLYKQFELARDRILEDTKDEIVYGMPAQEFLDKFLPVEVEDGVKWETKLFEKIPDPKVEGGTEHVMYGPLMTNVFKKIADGHGFIVNATDRAQDKNSTPDKCWAPDFMAYMSEGLDELVDEINLRYDNPNDFSRAEIPHEVKKEDFIDDKKKKRHESKTAKDNMGQILLVLAEVANRQHRTHVFHVFITPHIVRLTRMDQAGIVISAAIPAREDSSLVHEFYHRYLKASTAMRGHDPSVRWATKVEIEQARPHLKPWAPKHGRDRPFHVIKLPISDSPSTQIQTRAQKMKNRTVVVWAPMMELRGVTGRMTKTFVAYDLASPIGGKPQLYFFKDTWRSDNDDLYTEAEILTHLNEKQVQNIPTLIPGSSGDVRDDDNSIQRTKTQEFAEQDNKEKFTARIHHRLLEDFVPKRLDEFKNAKSLVKVIYDAMTAHEGAYSVSVLHRDVSANNILITEGPGKEEVGVLVDWDNAIFFRTVDGSKLNLEGARQEHRTVTGAFLSVGLLDYPKNPHTLQDDLESFYWVVLYMSLRYLKFTVTDSHTFEDLWAAIFDGRGKFEMLGGFGPAKGLRFPGNEALEDWVTTLRKLFKKLNDYLAEQAEQQASSSSSRPKYVSATVDSARQYPTSLQKHDTMKSMLSQIIASTAGWSEAKVDNSPRRLQASRNVKMAKSPSKPSKRSREQDTSDKDGDLEEEHRARRSRKVGTSHGAGFGNAKAGGSRSTVR